MNSSKPILQKTTLFFSAPGLLIFSFIIFFTISCNDEGVRKKPCLLTKSIATYTDGSTEEYNLTYNSENQLFQWASLYTSANNDVYTYNFEYTYDLNGNVIMETYDDGHVVYSYNSDNQVIREEYFDGSSKKVIIESEYNSTGQIIKRQHYSITSGDIAIQDYYSLIEYATSTTKNVLRSKKFNQNGTLVLTIEYQYDNKINPWTSMGVSVLYNHGENNITKETRTEGTTVVTYNYAYEYNGQDYPTKMTYSSTLGTNSYTEEYMYQCE